MDKKIPRSHLAHKISLMQKTSAPRENTEMWENLEQVTGIEPALKAWEALILPLNYTCVQRSYHKQRKNR